MTDGNWLFVRVEWPRPPLPRCCDLTDCARLVGLTRESFLSIFVLYLLFKGKHDNDIILQNDSLVDNLQHNTSSFVPWLRKIRNVKKRGRNFKKNVY